MAVFHSIDRMVQGERLPGRNSYMEIVRADPCCYCGGPGGTVDHIIAKARGGPRNDWTNMTGACVRCNGAKKSTTLLMFLHNDRQKWKPPGR